MGLEIERKFLLPEAPAWLQELPGERIQQGYLAVEGSVEVRLRRSEKGRVLAVKRGSGRTRDEVEVELAANAFDPLWALTDGRRVCKRRHLLEASEGTFEIDVYEEGLSGLIVAEIEFNSEAGATAFDPPAWIGTEVTDDEGFSNQQLALEGAPEGAEK